MSPEQELNEIRKELLANERLAKLLTDFSKRFADTALRKLYTVNEPALMIRQAGIAEGVELFMKDITKSPKNAPPDRSE